MPFIFVYGTLRADEVNDIRCTASRHGLPEPGSRGWGTVAGVLYDFGDYPGLVPDTGATLVLGEVYEIDLLLIPVLDMIEEVYPGRPSLFLRTVLTVCCDDGPIDCIVYPVQADAVGAMSRIDSGDWVRYRLMR